VKPNTYKIGHPPCRETFPAGGMRYNYKLVAENMSGLLSGDQNKIETILNYVDRRHGPTAASWVRALAAATRKFTAGDSAGRRVLPQEYSHAVTTLEWLLRIEPGASLELMLAAFGHDIERYDPEAQRVEIGDFPDYQSFKLEHQKRCGEVLCRRLISLGINETVSRAAANIAAGHEFGLDTNSRLVMQADSLSFFANNWPEYYRQKGIIRSKEKARFMFDRLSARNKKIVRRICRTRMKCAEADAPAYGALADSLF